MGFQPMRGGRSPPGARPVFGQTSVRRRAPWSVAASPATVHLYISMPRLGMSFGNLFSTHPLTTERIARLTGMGMQHTF